MGTAYTKTSPTNFVDGETINASDFTTEFDAIDAAFETGGHQHDGTDGEGGAIEKLLSNTITFGTGVDTDISVTFNANTADGVLTWMEDEDYFQFSDDLLISSTEKVQFRDTAIYINSSTDGQLDLVADTEIQIAATTVDINGNVDISGTLTIGSAGISEAELEILDGATVTTTELNIIDGDTSASATTVVDADRVVFNDAGTMKQVAVTDLAAYFDDEITAMPNLVTTAATTVGALNSGSITSGFGTIDTGSSTITTTGLITGGSLDIDDVVINGSTIGHTDDTDLITVANGVVTVAGEVSMTTLDIGGTNVTSTAAELNILDGKSFLDEDDMSSNSATGIPSQQSVKAYVDAEKADMSFVLEDGDGTEVTINKDNEVKFVEGGGLDIDWTDTDNGTDGDPYDLTFTVNATQTGITSLTNTSLVIGRDADNDIDFATDNNIIFRAAGADQIKLIDGVLAPVSDNDVDLGSSSLQFKDAYIHGTLEADAITIGGTAIAAAGTSSITTVGALDSGSITSGFGTINNGSSTITTTGAVSGGSFVVPDDGDIGSASATDAIQISSAGIVTFKDDIKIKDGGTIGVASAADAMTVSSAGIVTFKDDILIKDGGTIGVASTVDAMTVSSAGIVTFKDDILIKDGGTIGVASAADAMTVSSAGIVTFKDDILIKDGGTIGVASAATAMTIASSGIVTFVDDIIIKDAGTIGSASDTDALSISSGGVVNFTQAPTVASAAVKTAGKETIFVPAAACQPTASNGCAALANVETTSGRPDMQVLDFDASSDEHAQFQVAFPKSWNEGTVTFQVFWTTAATDTDGVAWGLQGVAVSDNDTIDVAYGSAVVVTDDALSAAEDLCVTAESGAVTIAGSPAANDMCFFRIFRDVSDANDDMAEDARLIGIKLFYTTDAANDA